MKKTNSILFVLLLLLTLITSIKSNNVITPYSELDFSITNYSESDIDFPITNCSLD